MYKKNKTKVLALAGCSVLGAVLEWITSHSKPSRHFLLMKDSKIFNVRMLSSLVHLFV